MKKKSADGAVRVEFASDLKAAQRLLARIVHALAKTEFSPREIFGIKLAVEEALVNAVKHGNRLDPGKKVVVEYRMEPTCFRVRIADEGSGYDPARVPDPMADENLERPGGRGLLLMRHYMTDVVVHPPGNRLEMTRIHDPAAG